MNNEITAERVRNFLLWHHGETLEALELAPASLPDDFDLLQTGVIDSLGLMEMMAAIENEFEIDVDFGALDTEDITVLGPLSRYIAEKGVPKSRSTLCA